MAIRNSAVDCILVVLQDVVYKLFKASDHASQDIKQFFDEAIDFIHCARIANGNVLVHW